eukprot:Sspe_Gene.3658::Locus_1219_Transcript_1_1_Confidence_1.000_Length_500::g.3658::m.3658
MAFFIDVGTDLFGAKQNTRLEFAGCPTMTELILAVEGHFGKEGRLRRPVGAPDVPFKVQSMQVYDDVLLRWVDLYSSSQLRNGSQGCGCSSPSRCCTASSPGPPPPEVQP